MTAISKTAKVVVQQPFKVTHAGIGYWPGEVAEVPSPVAAEWVKLGFAELVDPPVEKRSDIKQASDTDESEQATDDEPETEAKPSRRRR